MHKKKEKYTLKKKCHDEAKTEYIQKKERFKRNYMKRALRWQKKKDIERKERDILKKKRFKRKKI